MTPEQQCHLLQPGVEIFRSKAVDAWLEFVLKLQIGDMITVEILRTSIMQGSLELTILSASLFLDVTAQGIQELGKAIL